MKKKRVSLILSGFSSNETRKDSGGIQLGEISFCESLSKVPKFEVRIYAGGTKDEVIRIGDNLSAQTFDITKFPKKGGIIDTWRFSQLVKLELINNIYTNEDDIIHFTSIGPALNFLTSETDYFHKNNRFKSKVFYTFHNFHYGIADKPYDIFTNFPDEWEYLHNAEIEIGKKADCTIVTSKLLSVDLTKKLGRKVEYIPNTIGNIADYNVRPDNSHENIIFLTLARFAGEKNLIRTAEAFKELSLKVPSIRWVIGGDGELKEDLIAKLKELDLKYDFRDLDTDIKSSFNLLNQTQVLFLGQINTDEKEYALNHSDIFLLVSLREVSPLVGMESLVYGKVIVSSNIAGWHDFKDFGAKIFCAEPQDVDSITTNMHDACNLILGGGKMGAFEINRNVYKNNFSPKTVLDIRLGIYEQYGFK